MCYFVRLLARALLDWVSFQHGQTCFAVIQMMLDVLLSVMRRDANILSPKTNNGHVSSKTNFSYLLVEGAYNENWWALHCSKALS